MEFQDFHETLRTEWFPCQRTRLEAQKECQNEPKPWNLQRLSDVAKINLDDHFWLPNFGPKCRPYGCRISFIFLVFFDDSDGMGRQC